MLAVSAWQLRHLDTEEIFTRSARLALIVLVPAVIFTLLVGDELGVIEGRYQPMKIAAAEAQWTSVMVSSTRAAYNLTVHNTASGAYSLRVLTVVAVIFLPLVLGYQAWIYHVFRRRVSTRDFLPPSPSGAPDTAPGPGRGSQA
jgi:cytochrome bd-type quinol oxidase subunit 2